MKTVPDIGAMVDAVTPDEWLLARFDEYGKHGLTDADDSHHPPLFSFKDDHMREECSFTTYATSAICQYMSGYASWPTSITSYQLNATIYDSQIFRDLMESENRLQRGF